MTDAFCSHIFDYACLRRRAYSCRRGLKLSKYCVHQKFFEMPGGNIYTPTPSSFSLDPSLAISYRNHRKSRPYSIFQSLGTINIILFDCSKSPSQKGGERGMAQWSPLNTLLRPIYSCKVTLLNVREKYKLNQRKKKRCTECSETT